MSKQQKAIRSSGWKTDFLIGFPDGLLLLFFTTFLLHGLPVTVQQFYTLNACIWMTGGLLVMITAYRANHGDSQHEESTLSAEERQKLERLNISDPIIEDIAAEMQRDAVQWEETLEAQQVQERHFSLAAAIRSAILTGAFFLLGGIIPFFPYLRNENFTAAANSSLLYVFIAITVFSLLKSRMTSQQAIPVILRNLAYGGAVWLGAYIILAVFR
jgi:VIT1/CCC1 family predicted Fe2+/Mn2+ transporter